MPDWERIVRERVERLKLQGAAESDLTEEIARHLEEQYRELRSAGVPEAEAFAQTVAGLENVHALDTVPLRRNRMPRHELPVAGDTLKRSWFADLWHDLNYALRTMRKSPLFALLAILTLALGIGANTTVFTVFHALVLNPLPIPDSSHVAALNSSDLKGQSKSNTILPISYLDLKDYQGKNEVFSSLAGYTAPRVITAQIGGASERMFAELTTGNYFATLGLRPAAGRFFAPDEDGVPGAHPVAVMNFATWQARFGGSPAILGGTLRLNRIEFTIIGVAPPNFIGMNAVFGPDLWIPAAMAEQLLPTEMHNIFSDRARGAFQGVGRLRPGLTRTQAQANLTSIAAELEREYPNTNQGHAVTVRPISDVIFGSSGAGGSMVALGASVLLIVVGIVLLIACSNVANLLLARTAARRQEIAVRLAIGASRSRLMRQLLTENLLLGMLSGVTGLAIGGAGLQLIWSKVLPQNVAANMLKPHLDAAVFAYTLAVSLLTGLFCGAIPAIQASRATVVVALKEESHTVGRSRGKMAIANVLLAGQVAFSFLLLVTAALFLRSISRAYQIDPGFQTAHLAVFLTNPGQAGYGEARTKAFYKDVRERVSRLPGVRTVSWASNLPLWGRVVSGVDIEGRQQQSESESLAAVLNTIDLNYFETSGVTLERGRTFTDMDRDASTPVAIINEKMAHDYWPAGDALGKRIRIPGETAFRQIVGVARTANYSSVGEPPQACIYVPLAQHFSDAMTLYVRSKGAPEQVMMPVQTQMRRIGPEVMVNDIRTGRTIIDNGLFYAKFGVGLLSAFGLLALGLASIGLYGIMAYSASRRQREIGVRMALGAAQARVIRLILWQGMSVVLTGLIIGLGAAMAVGRLLSRMLYGVSATDPISVAAAAFVLIVMALVACYVPARRASRLDPLAALRES